MSRIYSCVLLKDRVLSMDGDPSHEAILREAGIKDDKLPPAFVRVEIAPPDGNYALPPDQWAYRADQDILPDWYVASVDEARARKALDAWAHDHTIVGEGQTIERGTYILVGGTVSVSGGKVYAYSGAAVTGVSGGKVYAHDNSTVSGVSGGVVAAHDNSTVSGVSGGVVAACDNSTVSDVSGGKVVRM